jgi:hypothetical protein
MMRKDIRTYNIYKVKMLLLFGLCLFLMSCGEDSFLDRREMYRIDNLNARVRIALDWQEHFGEIPSGMSLYTYNDKQGSQVEVSNSVKSREILRKEGEYALLVYNLTPGEFGSLEFHDMNNIDSAHVTLTPIQQYKNKKGWDEGVVYQREPEELGVARDNIEITQDMVASTYMQRYNHFNAGIERDTAVYEFKEAPKKVNIPLEVRVRVLGINNMKSVIGSIDQFADGWYLGQGHATSGEGIHLLDNFRVEYDSPNSKDGWIISEISTFGLPWGKQKAAERDSTSNRLSLYFTLRNGESIIFTYNVGELLHYVEKEDSGMEVTGEVTLELLLVISTDTSKHSISPSLPDVTGGDSDSNASGFTAEVDDWENGGSVDVGL